MVPAMKTDEKMENWCEMIIGKGESKNFGKSLPQCHIIHQKSTWTAMQLNPGLQAQ
jgi:hypothetical protein